MKSCFLDLVFFRGMTFKAAQAPYVKVFSVSESDQFLKELFSNLILL
jgi:hypothetical protein